MHLFSIFSFEDDPCAFPVSFDPHTLCYCQIKFLLVTMVASLWFSALTMVARFNDDGCINFGVGLSQFLTHNHRIMCFYDCAYRLYNCCGPLWAGERCQVFGALVQRDWSDKHCGYFWSNHCLATPKLGLTGRVYIFSTQTMFHLWAHWMISYIMWNLRKGGFCNKAVWVVDIVVGLHKLSAARSKFNNNYCLVYIILLLWQFLVDSIHQHHLKQQYASQ